MLCFCAPNEVPSAPLAGEMLKAWKEEYANDAKKLMKLFKRNFVSYGQEVEYLVKSGPK